MDASLSKDLAFFSMLTTFLHFDLNKEAQNFSISLNELEEKSELKADDILKNIEKLEGMNFLKIKEKKENILFLDLSNSINKLNEVFSVTEIDKMIKEFEKFIYKYDGFIIKNEKLKKYSEEIRNIIHKNPLADINPIIMNGVRDIFSDELIILLESKIYNLSEIINIDNNQTEDLIEDLKIIEVIIFCFCNFPKEENPFLVTLFLASIF